MSLVRPLNKFCLKCPPRPVVWWVLSIISSHGVIHKPRGKMFGYFLTPSSPLEVTFYKIRLMQYIEWSFG